MVVQIGALIHDFGATLISTQEPLFVFFCLRIEHSLDREPVPGHAAQDVRHEYLIVAAT